jgi:hypothetical protein
VIFKVGVAVPTKGERATGQEASKTAQLSPSSSTLLHTCIEAIAAVALFCSYTCQQSDCIPGPSLFYPLPQHRSEPTLRAQYNTDQHSIATSIANTHNDHSIMLLLPRQYSKYVYPRHALLMRLP